MKKVSYYINAENFKNAKQLLIIKKIRSRSHWHAKTSKHREKLNRHEFLFYPEQQANVTH